MDSCWRTWLLLLVAMVAAILTVTEGMALRGQSECSRNTISKAIRNSCQLRMSRRARDINIVRRAVQPLWLAKFDDDEDDILMAVVEEEEQERNKRMEKQVERIKSCCLTSGCNLEVLYRNACDD